LLETPGQSCDEPGWQVHAYCLMSNHFHLVVETPEPNLVAGRKWLLGTCTSRFNRRRQEFGHMFSGRCKAHPAKVEMAWRLRRETTITLKWIAKRLRMGVWTHVSDWLVQKRKQDEKSQ